MHHALITLALAALLPADAPDQAKAPAPPSAGFAALEKEYQAAEAAFLKVSRERYAKATAEKKRFYIPFSETPPARLAARYLEFAEKNPADPSAFDALARAISGSYENHDVRHRTLERLRASYLADPRMKRLVGPLVISQDDETERFVYELIARCPDRDVRVLAYKVLIKKAENAIEIAARLRADSAARADVEANEGKAYLEAALARGDRSKADLENFRKIAREEYGDRIPDLSVGKPAPDLIGRTLDGRDAKISDYRGKVVVLDIWATWCGPCRQMIPHEREMVARLKDRPFALISISVDEEKETLTEFLTREPMPWTHWWNGSEGKIIDALDIDHYPTIFVLDGNGIIRAKEIRGEELEAKVNGLLGESTTDAGQAERPAKGD
ncbi:Thiol-disulfide oxidoreductase ResA [Aquisphaera giovannonii]|uniref:Thiol-disulfide oxidoreductase ResA n=1 Tax=Aquisphaera giovannonii TaxID=406548 RepID=A0A5B9W3K6_9BACT|nr:TlpA disulfide reductase family protein [Aquisphaera giovannonii]QEH34824.1 Thiol-disulfide oxidoreductase ResA [Aquisphaera giovannonii]